MLLLTGRPGSGTTSEALAAFISGSRPGGSAFALLTPAATMAEHLRHRAAREGAAVRPSRIMTLNRFVEQYAAGFRQVPAAVLNRLVREVLERDPPPAFRDAAGMPGIAGAIAGLIEEFAMAGLEILEFEQWVRRGAAPVPHGAALAEVLRRVESLLLERAETPRGTRLRSAALAIREKGLAELRGVVFDGFFSFSAAELELIEAIAGQADEVVVTLPDWKGGERARDELLRMGFEERRLASRAPPPECEIVRAANLDSEVGEVARRIVEESRRRPFRSIGVVVRGAASYRRALETAFERFGIPARFYFPGGLASHPAVRRLTRLLDAAAAGWDLDMTLRAVRMGNASAALDAFDRAGRARIPAEGLDVLAGLAADGAFEPPTAGFREIDGWRSSPACPDAWPARLARLRDLFPFPRLRESVTHEQANLWREHAAALDGFEEALAGTARALDPGREYALGEFWAEAHEFLTAGSLRARDRRHNVVHVMDAYEARLWELPVVFVCGLVEGEFPRRRPQHPLLGDEARIGLRRLGYDLRTSAEQNRDEEALFPFLTALATDRLILTYPAHDAKGEPALPSLPLEEFRRQLGRAPDSDSRAAAALPAGRRERPLLLPSRIYAEDLRREIAARHAAFTPSGLETFLACPFRFFAEKTLRLEPAPPAPGDRLDSLLQGKIVHAVLERLAGGQDLADVFDRVFDEASAEENVPPGFRTESVRQEMRRSLEAWLAAPVLPAAGRVLRESSFEFGLEDGPRVRGRIDRIDVYGDGKALVIDFKYSNPDRLGDLIRDTEEGRRVQAGLYMLAARRCFELDPAGMLYCALRGGTRWDGWHAGLPDLKTAGKNTLPDEIEGLIRLAGDRARSAAAEILGGRTEPSPADPSGCRWCGCLDICRAETAIRAAVAGGESE